MEGLKTYTGLIVALIGAICTIFKINITTTEIQPIINAGLELGGLMLAAYGRIVTKANT